MLIQMKSDALFENNLTASPMIVTRCQSPLKLTPIDGGSIIEVENKTNLDRLLTPDTKLLQLFEQLEEPKIDKNIEYHKIDKNIEYHKIDKNIEYHQFDDSFDKDEIVFPLYQIDVSNKAIMNDNNIKRQVNSYSDKPDQINMDIDLEKSKVITNNQIPNQDISNSNSEIMITSSPNKQRCLNSPIQQPKINQEKKENQLIDFSKVQNTRYIASKPKELPIKRQRDVFGGEFWNPVMFPKNYKVEYIPPNINESKLQSKQNESEKVKKPLKNNVKQNNNSSKVLQCNEMYPDALQNKMNGFINEEKHYKQQVINQTSNLFDEVKEFDNWRRQPTKNALVSSLNETVQPILSSSNNSIKQENNIQLSNNQLIIQQCYEDWDSDG